MYEVTEIDEKQSSRLNFIINNLIYLEASKRLYEKEIKNKNEGLDKKKIEGSTNENELMLLKIQYKNISKLIHDLKHQSENKVFLRKSLSELDVIIKHLQNKKKKILKEKISEEKEEGKISLDGMIFNMKILLDQMKSYINDCENQVFKTGVNNIEIYYKVFKDYINEQKTNVREKEDFKEFELHVDCVLYEIDKNYGNGNLNWRYDLLIEVNNYWDRIRCAYCLDTSSTFVIEMINDYKNANDKSWFREVLPEVSLLCEYINEIRVEQARWYILKLLFKIFPFCIFIVCIYYFYEIRNQRKVQNTSTKPSADSDKEDQEVIN